MMMMDWPFGGGGGDPDGVLRDIERVGVESKPAEPLVDMVKWLFQGGTSRSS
jgi:hypothetical protein